MTSPALPSSSLLSVSDEAYPSTEVSTPLRPLLTWLRHQGPGTMGLLASDADASILILPHNRGRKRRRVSSMAEVDTAAILEELIQAAKATLLARSRFNR